MGSSQSSDSKKKIILSQRMNMGGCRSDLDCQNPDAARSTLGEIGSDPNLVLSCPNAICEGANEKGNGTCKCGTGCILDKYSGTCCQDIINIRGDQFCIEYTEPPKISSALKGFKCEARNQIFTQDGKTVNIPSAKICEWASESLIKIDTEDPTEEPQSTEGFQSVSIARSFLF